MEKQNNKKYFIFSIVLFTMFLELCYNACYLNNIYIYKHFDFTGVAQIVEPALTIIGLIISAVCLYKAVKAREDGVDFLFNKCIALAFAIYVVLSMVAYIGVRSYEESLAKKMQADISVYSENIKQNELAKYKETLKDEGYNILSDILAKTEYSTNDKAYERKVEIIEQVDNSSFFNRYMSLVLHNPSYKYYAPVKLDELEYYQTFLKCFFTGVLGVVCYSLNMKSKAPNTDIYYKEDENVDQ